MYTKNVSRTINTEINWYHNLFNFTTDVTSFKLLKFNFFLMDQSELTATKFWSIFSHSSLSRYQLSPTLHNPYFPILYHFFISNSKTHLKKSDHMDNTKIILESRQWVKVLYKNQKVTSPTSTVRLTGSWDKTFSQGSQRPSSQNKEI